jgi:hypothetical protein
VHFFKLPALVKVPALLAFLSLGSLAGCQAQGTSPGSARTKAPVGAGAAAPRNTIRLYSIGHSLSAEIPDMTAALASATPGLTYSFQEQFRLGASLQAQWEEASKPRDQWDDAQFRISYPKALPKGDFNTVVLIDSVPRGGAEHEAQSVEYLTKFVNYIAQTNPAARIYFAEAWHSVLSGTGKAQWDTISPTRNLDWRARIDADAPMWERIRARVAQATGREIVLIPQARALGKFVDAIEAGQVPGFNRKEDVFGDDIHLNPYGMYFLACFHYAVLFGKSPEGLPLEIKNRWGVDYWGKPFNGGRTYSKPDAEGIRAMQRLAWQLAK